MELSPAEQAISILPEQHRERARAIAVSLSGAELDIFTEQMKRLGEQCQKDAVIEKEELQKMDRLIADAEHMVKSSERAEKHNAENADHSADMQQAESILDTL